MSQEEAEKLRLPPQSQRPQNIFVPPCIPALGIGLATGACGVAYGRIAATLIQSKHPLAYTSFSGAQWFCGGATFFYCRSELLAGPLSRDNSLHRIAASGIAGSCSGVVAAAFVSRGSMITGSILFGLFGAASQAGLNALPSSPTLSQLPARITQGVISLVPMKSLSDREYEDLLLSKLVKFDAEISLLDDRIADLRAARDAQNAASSEQLKDRPA